MITLAEATKKLAELKARDYVASLRRGPTGIGHTLETLLGIEENNISAPDLGDIELKARRESHSGLLTLFTFNQKSWKMPQLQAIQQYGTPDEVGRLGLYFTMSQKPNSSGLFLAIDDKAVSVRSVDGTLIAEWELEAIQKRFQAKVNSVLLVDAAVEERNGIEYFWFKRARLLHGGATAAIIRNQFESGRLLLDLRLHDAGTAARNHGTGFRIKLNDLENFYRHVEEIDL